MPGRDSSHQNGDTDRWTESERWSERGGRSSAGGGSVSGGGSGGGSGNSAPVRDRERDVRRDDDFNEPPQPRNDRWKEPEPRADDRGNSRWAGYDDVRRSSSRRDEVRGVLVPGEQQIG